MTSQEKINYVKDVLTTNKKICLGSIEHQNWLNWAESLLSGNYQQGKDALLKFRREEINQVWNEEWCCLGVYCHTVEGIEKKKLEDKALPIDVDIHRFETMIKHPDLYFTISTFFSKINDGIEINKKFEYFSFEEIGKGILLTFTFQRFIDHIQKIEKELSDQYGLTREDINLSYSSIWEYYKQKYNIPNLVEKILSKQ